MTISPVDIRNALAGIAQGAGSSEALTDAELLAGLYPVAAHVKAFHPDRVLVVGGRGTGKTQLARALLLPAGRSALARISGDAVVRGTTGGALVDGFSGGRVADGPRHPDADAIEEAVGGDPGIPRARRFWLAVVVARLALSGDVAPLIDDESARESRGAAEAAASARGLLAWTDADIERPFRVLHRLDDAARRAGRTCIVTFDALDRAANTPRGLAAVIGGLLSVALDVAKRLHAIRLKVFLRPDLERTASLEFPDASKLGGYRVSLEWRRDDLYRMMLKRAACSETCGLQFRQAVDGWTRPAAFQEDPALGWTPTDVLDETGIRAVITRLAGRYMGPNPKKGESYHWVPNHLADGYSNVSPRSFVVAFQSAATWMTANRAAEPLPLIPSSLQVGVEEASTQRVNELAEDFPWVHAVRDALEGLLVPCSRDDVTNRLADLELPDPRALPRSDADSILDLLFLLGVFSRHQDGRLNVPDLYRVALRMKRKGGIRLAR